MFDRNRLLARVDGFNGVWGAEGSKGAAMWDYCREILEQGVGERVWVAAHDRARGGKQSDGKSDGQLER